MKERGQRRPEGMPNSQSKPKPPERQPQSGSIKSAECYLLPNVWDVLERSVKLNAPDVKDRPRWGSDEYKREVDELNRLGKELSEKGTPRDRLIFELQAATIIEPGDFPVVAYPRNISLEEFQQFRSKVEPLSEEELREERRRADEEYELKRKENSLSVPSPNSLAMP
jgi:hypothetical protein